MKKVSWSNVLAVVVALYIGAYCSGCTYVTAQAPEPATAGVQFIGLKPIVPDAIVKGVWEEVGRCLQQPEMDPAIIRWAVAEHIVDIDRKQLLWGVVANVYWNEGPAYTAVVDRRVRHNVRVWSHEIVHVRGDVLDGDWHLNACTLDLESPYILPLRPLTDEQVAALIER